MDVKRRKTRRGVLASTPPPQGTDDGAVETKAPEGVVDGGAPDRGALDPTELDLSAPDRALDTAHSQAELDTTAPKAALDTAAPEGTLDTAAPEAAFETPALALATTAPEGTLGSTAPEQTRPGNGPKRTPTGAREQTLIGIAPEGALAAPDVTLTGLGPDAARAQAALEGTPGTTAPEAPWDDALDEPLSEPKAPKRRIRWGRIVKIAFGLLAALLVACAVALYFTVQHYSKDLPSVESLKRGYEPPQITRVFARDQTLLGSIFKERRTVVPFEQIPDAAKLAFLAAEDARFYEHEGINYFGILRALYANVRAGRMVQGGSTITQQVIKNVLLDSERSLRRKVREVLLVHRLEHSLSKDEIFWLYLNHIYLGHGRYGIEEAARFYFGKPAKDLGLEEASTLAGLVASPENYSPRRDPEKSLRRRAFVLDQMLQKGFVTPELFETSSAAPLRLAPAEEAESRLAPEMMDHARAVLQRTLPAASTSGGFQVTTTLDPALQAAARQAVRDAIDAYMKRHELLPPYTAPSRKLWADPFVGAPKPFRIYTGIVEGSDDQKGTLDVRVGDVLGQVSLVSEGRYNPGHLKPSEFAKPGAALRVSVSELPTAGGKAPLRLELGPQGALLALDIRSRDVVAMVGGYEAVLGGLDRSTQTRRQPGSAFKPILFSYALHTRRITPASVIPVEKRKQGVPAEGPLSIALRDAVAHSNNDAAEEVMRMVGPSGVVEWARALGIESPLGADLSLALGSYETSLLEMTNAYAALANGGNAGEPRFIVKAMTPMRAELVLPARAPDRAVLSPDEAYLTTSLLRSVVRYGTGRAAQSLGRDAAGKTGTTNDAKDAWFVGYTTDYVAGVWIGYDDALPLGPGESGAKTALPAWLQFMKAAHEGRPKTDFAKTPGILTVAIDPKTGLLPWPGEPDTRNEEFLAGTEPVEVAPVPSSSADAGAPSAAPGASTGPGMIEAPAPTIARPDEPPPF
jgi:penicillin-binding protein 1A